MDRDLIVIVIVALIAIVIIKAALRKRPSQPHTYRLRSPFLSPAERSFFGVLCTAFANHYIVLAKVRVADVITPAKEQDRSKWQTAFNMISAKHFDYVLCDPSTLSVAHVVELHDRSHGSAKRTKRDDFLRNACQSAELPLWEFPAKKGYSIEEVRSQVLGGPGDGRVEPKI